MNIRTLVCAVVGSGALLAHLSPVYSHDLTIADVLVVFKTNGTYQVDVSLNLDTIAIDFVGAAKAEELNQKAATWPAADVDRLLAVELNAILVTWSQAEVNGLLDAAGDKVGKYVRVRFDDTKVESVITFPEFRAPSPNGANVSTMMGTTARLSGRVPDGAKEFTLGLSRIVASAAQLTILDQKTAGGVRHVLGASEDSPPYRLGEPVQPVSRVDIIARYLVLGFEHILPKGVDHILFVLGLFLLSTKMRPLLWQITAFTVAHSVTLGLSMYGVVTLPSRIVESLIALSITYVAVENLVTTELKPWRPAIVFGFGLLHGLGFAGVLRELGLPQGEFASSLIAFNVGVELGQLSVVLLAFLAVGWFRRKTWYRASIVLPLSALIALTGFYWTVQRAFYGM